MRSIRCSWVFLERLLCIKFKRKVLVSSVLHYRRKVLAAFDVNYIEREERTGGGTRRSTEGDGYGQACRWTG